ncbi:MAG: PVC-type heme-binding CxxCH protein [Phycisphaerae bacterium]|nr:PVC-type heme-binding CxxCH protein [Tepidisphaeraceae bacterium]
MTTKPLAAFALVLSSTVAAQPQPLPPEETAKQFKLPPGFTASLVAGEPDLVQPISFCFDDRGRLWVIESLTYPKWDLSGKTDRISVFEDLDGDGKCEKKTVFLDTLTGLTGIEHGFGGVWVVGHPNLYFIPDKDGDLKPDGPPQVLLNGFGKQGTHNLVSGLIWGPDGWLYGGHGGTSSGWIGAPDVPAPQNVVTPSPTAAGTFHRHPVVTGDATDPAKVRLFYDGGVWRYHPQRHVFEPVSEGTTNPWGLDYNEYGQFFISNSVTPHLYHVIPGSHVERRRASPNSRFAYEVLPSTADHKHYAGADWAKARIGQAELGGGHSHCGLMIYQADVWPAEFRRAILMNNIHGDRMNRDLPVRKGSGYTASHGADFLTNSNPWYMALHVKQTPDGNAIVSDWYDTGECHTTKPNQANGRLYKITYTGPRSGPVFELPAGADPAKSLNLGALKSSDLARLQVQPNEWLARRARRLLQERGAADPQARLVFHKVLGNREESTPQRLRALWSLHVTEPAEVNEVMLLSLTTDPDEYVRGWVETLLAEPRTVSKEVLAAFEALAKADPSPWVRRSIASAVTRIPLADRWPILAALASHEDAATDANLPQMIWYGLEPLVTTDPKRAIALASNGKIAKLREWVVRRIADK